MSQTDRQWCESRRVTAVTHVSADWRHWAGVVEPIDRRRIVTLLYVTLKQPQRYVSNISDDIQLYWNDSQHGYWL